MRWNTATQVLLFTLALSKWLLPAAVTPIQEPSLAGMPLSDVEYERFFRTLNSPHRVSAVCFLRATYGCKYSLIQTLDRYENHGVIPEGRVCSGVTDISTFPDFCTFTFYRCTLKRYFEKRILCPEDITKTSADRELKEEEPDNSAPSLTPGSLTEPLTTTTTTTQPFPELHGATTTTAATGANPERYSALPAVDTPAPVPDLTAATATESLFDLLAEASLKPLFATAAAIATEPFPKAAPAVPASTTAAAEVAPGRLTPSIAKVATTESVLELLVPTSATTEPLLDVFSGYSLEPPAPTSPEEPGPEFSSSTLHTLSAPTAADSPPAPNTREPSSELLTTTTVMRPAPAIGNTIDRMLFEGATPDISAATATMPSAELPASTAAAPGMAFGAPVVSTTTCMTPGNTTCVNPLPLNSTGSTAPALSTKATSNEEPPEISAATASVPFFVPILARPRSNSSMHVYIVSTFIRHKPEGLAGLIPLLQFGARAASLRSQETIPNPQPTADLQDLFFRLQNNRVQQLMQEMRDLMAKGKAIQKRQLQATSLQLLRALSHASRQRKSKRSLRLKGRLQR